MAAEEPELGAQAAPPADAGLRAEPLPQPLPEALPEPSKSSGGFGIGKTAAGAVGLLLFAGIAVGLIPMPGFGPSQPAPPAPIAIEQTASHPSGPSLIQPIAAAAEMQKAVDSLLVTDTDKAKVRSEIASGKTRIGWITVSDSDAEDGDWVTLTGAGFAQGVQLYHRATTLAVPYAPGVPVTVTGRTDGDGKGITVAVYVGGSSFSLAPMQVGTSVQVPTP
jgi:hypothetical protein